MNRQRRLQSGHAMITVTICIVTLIAFAGLATDVGYVETVKRGMQTAADAAAIAGAQEILRNHPSQVTTAANYDATYNGYTNGSNNTTVTVNNPPTSGFYQGDNNAVEVIVQQSNQPLSFLSILGVTPATVAARAVAHLGAGNGCILTLDPSSRSSLTFDGTVDANLHGCNVLVNSNNCSAMVANGTAYVAAAGFGVAGSCPGYTGSVGTNYSTQPTTGLLPAPDPLASLPAPTVGTCQTFNPGVSTIAPGTYCGGITITGGTYTFQPGTYIIEGGLTINGGTVTGNGVFFYLTGSLTGPPATRYGPVSIGGNAAVTFTAPSSGTYTDVLFYQDRSLNLTSSPNLSSSITGTANSVFNGIMYFPTSQVTFTGSGATAASDTQIIAYDLKLAGTPNFSGNFNAMPGGPRIKMVVLGE